MKKKTNDYKWHPLISDTNIFNNYFHNCGIPEFIGFDEILSFEIKENFIEGFPIFGVIAAVDYLKPSNKIYKNNKIKNNDVYFIKQTNELDLACGLIAVLNVIGNNLNKIILEKQSLLDVFFENTKSLNFNQRSKYLENYKELKELHYIYSNNNYKNNEENKSSNNNKKTSKKNNEDEIDDDIDKNDKLYHFISYTIIGNKIYEFDGFNKKPNMVEDLEIKLNKEKNSFEIFLEIVIEDLKNKIKSNYIGDDLSLMYLGYI